MKARGYELSFFLNLRNECWTSLLQVLPLHHERKAFILSCPLLRHQICLYFLDWWLLAGSSYIYWAIQSKVNQSIYDISSESDYYVSGANNDLIAIKQNARTARAAFKVFMTKYVRRIIGHRQLAGSWLAPLSNLPYKLILSLSGRRRLFPWPFHDCSWNSELFFSFLSFLHLWIPVADLGEKPDSSHMHFSLSDSVRGGPGVQLSRP